jgi:hypothetical protein
LSGAVDNSGVVGLEQNPQLLRWSGGHGR